MTSTEENRSVPAPEADVAATSDVFVVLDKGWHATCECGHEVAVESQVAGWSWVLNHACNPMAE